MAKLLSTIIDGFLSSRKFISGLMGEGWGIWKRGGRYTLEVDDIVVRNTMRVFELLISKIRAVKGALCITQASGKVNAVREEDNYYVLTLEEENSFQPDDLVRCQNFGEGQRAYWVKISLVKELKDELEKRIGTEIFIQKGEFTGEAGLPLVGDEIVQFGNTTDAARQSAIYLSADENGVPAIDVLQGVREKSFEGCMKVRVGGLDGIVDTDFPEGIKDYGIYCENGYFKGTIAGAGGYLLRSDGTGYICNGAIWWDTQKKVHFDGEVSLEWENLPPDAKELLKGDKGDKGDPGETGDDANLLPWVEEWNGYKTVINGDSFISPKIFSGKQEEDNSLTGVAIGREVIEKDGKKKTGIFGLAKGEETFSIDAETGEAMYRGQLNVNDKFTVNTNGKMIAKDADISGNVKASEGIIGGFSIGASRIGMNLKDVDSGNFGMGLYEDFIRFRSSNRFAAIGINTFAASTGALSTARFEISDSQYETSSVDNIALYLSATGCPEKYSDVGKNMAIEIANGHIKMGGSSNIIGLGLSIRVVSSNTTLTNDDSVVFTGSIEDGVIIKLPSSPKDGKVLFIRKCNSGNVTINGNGKKIRIEWNDQRDSNTLDYAYMHVYVYSSVLGYWMRNLIGY